ncbi:MAG: sigma-70 family RNA polymerase sigma factor [Paraclostridium sp.]
MNTQKHFYATVGDFPVLTAKQERELFVKYEETGCLEAREQIIVSNIRLSMKIAKKYVNNGLDYSDLYQEGFIGLMSAIDKFDISKGYRFSTYAFYVINQSIKTALQEKRNLVRVPQYIANNLYKVRQYVEENPSATKEELSEVFEMTEKTITAMLGQLQEFMDIDSIDVEHDDENLKEMEWNELIEDLNKAIDNHLTEEEAIIIRARAGLISDAKATLSDAAAMAGVQRSSVRDIEQAAMGKLSELEELKAYVIRG